MTSPQRKIEAITAEFRTWGYYVASEPIIGQEETYIEALFSGLENMRRRIAFNRDRYGFRGRSKNAIKALHNDLPEPTWGVELL